MFLPSLSVVMTTLTKGGDMVGRGTGSRFLGLLLSSAEFSGDVSGELARVEKVHEEVPVGSSEFPKEHEESQVERDAEASHEGKLPQPGEPFHAKRGTRGPEEDPENGSGDHLPR